MDDAIGFIGAGQMGEPMVRQLLQADRDVLVYARRDEVRDRLAKAGARLADSIGELAARSDVVISCLFSDQQLRAVAAGPHGLLANAKPGAVLVSHTTGNVSTLAELANATRGAILDAPVSGTADDIAAGNLTVLVGGPDEAVERVKPVLAAYADPIIATGELGSALNIKLINNVLFAANAQLVAAAVEVGRRLRIEPEALLTALSVCSGGSKAAMYVQSTGGIDAFANIAAPFLRKDFAAAVAAAAEAEVDLGLLHTAVHSGPLNLTELPPEK
ncbi:NAD(P)-dependent oxidoreductase [Mycobacterium branderi]|uniref:NAD(P)-dependent oxidoreductase n=1 Tax=Mycobacterium branderi TaxID=43348 RepID=UPI00111C2CE1|nr:NAD(P)-dependent oxidoreductase [Mycobacterium branderi]MCV7231686.1 NAD(P)-dependent oxidoreductase [Mycobacterium branderi]